MIREIADWQKNVFKNPDSWEGNNLHIDDVSLVFNDKETWVTGGFCCFDILLELEAESKSNRLIPFLHFVLQNSQEDSVLKPIERKTLNLIIDDFTPPSLHYCEQLYLNDFIEQLKPCIVSKSDSEFKRFKFFYSRVYFDKRENSYSRELYVFNYLNM